MEGNLPVLLCLTLYLRAISKYKPLGGLYLEGRFNGRFFALRVWGARLFLEGLISKFHGIFHTDIVVKSREAVVSFSLKPNL